jgi:signal transduction histidine kinase
MIPGLGSLRARPLRVKLALLLAAPLSVVIGFAVVLYATPFGSGEIDDLDERARLLQESFGELLEEASALAREGLAAESGMPGTTSRLETRLEGRARYDSGRHIESWDGLPSETPRGFLDAEAPAWRIRLDGVRTRLLARAGPDEEGRWGVATFILDSSLGDLVFAAVLPQGLRRGLQVEAEFVEPATAAAEASIRERSQAEPERVVVPLRTPGGELLGALSLQPVPSSYRQSVVRSAGRTWTAVVMLALLAVLFDWSRWVVRGTGLLGALAVLVASRGLLALVGFPPGLLPHELSTASLYGSHEAWRLLASPADLLLTAITLYLASRAVCAYLARLAMRSPRMSVALMTAAALAVVWAIVGLIGSLARNSRVPLLGREEIWSLDGVFVLVLALVAAMLGAAELAAAVWRLVAGRSSVSDRRVGRVPVALAFLVLALAGSLLLELRNDQLVFERLRSELAPQILEQTARRTVALNASIRHVLETVRDDEAAAERWSAQPEFMAYHFWVTGELFHGGYKSSLDFYTPNGMRLSHFGFDVPRLDEPILLPEALNVDLKVEEEVFLPTGALEQRLLHAEVPVVRNGEPLGVVVGHVLDEPDNLPFLPSSQPYLAALGPGSPLGAREEFSRGLQYVRYDAHGTVLLSTLPQPPAETDPLRDAALRGEPVRLRAGDETYTGLAFAERDGLHLLLVPGSSMLDRLAAAVRLGLLGLVLLALLALARRMGRRNGLRDLLQDVRRSFHRKLLAALLLASILPLIGLALFLRGTIEQRGAAALEQSAIQFVGSAQRVLEDYAVIQLEGEGVSEIELDDSILYWLRRVVGQEIHVYEDGLLRASSKRELFASGMLPPRIDGAVERGLVQEGRPYLVRRAALGPTEIPVAYAPVRTVHPTGELVVAVPLVLAPRQIERAVNRVSELILLATVILVGLLAVAATYLARTVARPVGELVEVTRRISAGDYATRLAPRTRDEIAALVQGFNSMAAALTAQRADLEHRREYMERLLQHATTGVVSVDAAGRIVTLNPAARRLLAGAELHAGVVLPAALSGVDELRPLAAALAAPSPHPGEPREVDLERSGSPQRLRLVEVELPNPGGGSIGTLILLDDVTELMRSNQLAAWAEMARAIAHEIKNPLTPIQLSTEHLTRLLRDRGVLPAPEVEACLETVIKQVRMLYQIAGEFSAYAKLPDLTPEPTDPVAFLRRTIDPYRSLELQNVTLEEHYEPTGEVAIDERVLSRAVINLIENALQAMPEGGKLTLAVGPDGGSDEVVMSVSDTGVGLSSEARHRLFEPYFSTKSSGTGLGLAIARRAVEAHLGRIEVQSAPGRGTTFRIHLPVLPDALP